MKAIEIDDTSRLYWLARLGSSKLRKAEYEYKYNHHVMKVTSCDVWRGVLLGMALCLIAIGAVISTVLFLIVGLIWLGLPDLVYAWTEASLTFKVMYAVGKTVACMAGLIVVIVSWVCIALFLNMKFKGSVSKAASRVKASMCDVSPLVELIEGWAGGFCKPVQINRSDKPQCWDWNA